MYALRIKTGLGWSQAMAFGSRDELHAAIPPADSIKGYMIGVSYIAPGQPRGDVVRITTLIEAVCIFDFTEKPSEFFGPPVAVEPIETRQRRAA